MILEAATNRPSAGRKRRIARRAGNVLCGADNALRGVWATYPAACGQRARRRADIVLCHRLTMGSACEMAPRKYVRFAPPNPEAPPRTGGGGKHTAVSDTCFKYW